MNYDVIIESTLKASFSKRDSSTILALFGLLGKVKVPDIPSPIRYFTVDGTMWFAWADIRKFLGLVPAKVKVVCSEANRKSVIRDELYSLEDHPRTDLFLSIDRYIFFNEEGLISTLDYIKKNAKSFEDAKDVVEVIFPKENLGMSDATYQYICEELKSPQLIKVFYDFCVMRKRAKKSPVTDVSVELLIDRLREVSGGREDVAIKIVNKSIVSCWKTFFPLKAGEMTDLSALEIEDNSHLLTDIGSAVEKYEILKQLIDSLKSAGVKEVTFKF